MILSATAADWRPLAIRGGEHLLQRRRSVEGEAFPHDVAGGVAGHMRPIAGHMQRLGVLPICIPPIKK